MVGWLSSVVVSGELHCVGKRDRTREKRPGQRKGMGIGQKKKKKLVC